PGHDLLRNGSLVSESRTPATGGLGTWPNIGSSPSRNSKNRWRLLGAPALHAPSALERRTDRHNRAVRQGRPLHRYPFAAHRRLDVGTHATGNFTSAHQRFD